MISEFAIDYENKYPLEPADWELPAREPLTYEQVSERIVLPALHHAARQVSQRQTLRAPESDEAPAPVSAESLYRLIRSPGGLALLMFGGAA